MTTSEPTPSRAALSERGARPAADLDIAGVLVALAVVCLLALLTVALR